MYNSVLNLKAYNKLWDGGTSPRNSPPGFCKLSRCWTGWSPSLPFFRCWHSGSLGTCLGLHTHSPPFLLSYKSPEHVETIPGLWVSFHNWHRRRAATSIVDRMLHSWVVGKWHLPLVMRTGALPLYLKFVLWSVQAIWTLIFLLKKCQKLLAIEADSSTTTTTNSKTDRFILISSDSSQHFIAEHN